MEKYDEHERVIVEYGNPLVSFKIPVTDLIDAIEVINEWLQSGKPLTGVELPKYNLLARMTRENAKWIEGATELRELAAKVKAAAHEAILKRNGID